MNNRKYMSISEFAKISGTTRRNLLFYDEIGLLSPAFVGDNGYRYYTLQQFHIMDIINMLKEIGMPLKEIKEFLQTRTPQKAVDLFSKQEQKILSEIERLTYYHKSLQTYIWQIKQSATFELNKLVPERCPAEYFLVSEKCRNAENLISMKVYFEFVSSLDKKMIDTGYPMGLVIYGYDGFSDKPTKPEYLPIQMIQRVSEEDSKKYTDSDLLKKEAGYYLSEFKSLEQDDTDSLTEKMKKYIVENNLQIAGPIWEFWWQDDSVTQDPKEQIYQTSVRVIK